MNPEALFLSKRHWKHIYISEEMPKWFFTSNPFNVDLPLIS